MSKLVDMAKRLGRAVLDKAGHEVLDPTPIELPVGFERPESIQELIRRLVTDPAMRAELQQHEVESFDEADDFDIADDAPISPHEDHFDPLHLLAREQEINSGAVRPRSAEEVDAARKVLSDHKAAVDAAKAAKAKLAPDVGA